MTTHFKIRLTKNLEDSRIEMNGELLGGVTAFSVAIDTETHRPIVTMTLLPDLIEGDVVCNDEPLSEEYKTQILDLTRRALDATDVRVQTQMDRPVTRGLDGQMLPGPVTSINLTLSALELKKEEQTS